MQDRDIDIGLFLIESFKLKHNIKELLETMHKNNKNEFSFRSTRNTKAYNLAIDSVASNIILFNQKVIGYLDIVDYCDIFTSWLTVNKIS